MRVVATLMVVFFHCLCIYTPFWGLIPFRVKDYYILADFLNSIDMPAFVFISGYLYAYLKLEKGKYVENKAFVVNKVKRLLIPYLLLSALLYLLGEVNDPAILFYGVSHLWFLLMLFEVFVLMQLTQRFWQRLSFSASLILCALLFVIFPYLPGFLPGKLTLVANKFLNYMPMFYIGMVSRQHVLPMLCKKKWGNSTWLLLSMLALALVAVVSYLSTVYLFPCSRTLRWVVVFVFLILVLRWLDGISSSIHINSWVSSFDRNSLGIYLIHHILLKEACLHSQAYCSFMTDHYQIAPLLVFFVVLALSWFLADLINRSPLRFILGS